MTLALTRPRPRRTASARTAQEGAESPYRDIPKRLEWARRDALATKVIEARRVLLCSGCNILGWYEAGTPIGVAVADLVRWCADPDHLVSKGWPFLPAWHWEAGEAVAVWHAGRLEALVVKGADGAPAVTRFDGAAAAE